MSSSNTSAQRSITIGAPADTLYRFWRDPQVLATIMDGVAEVTTQDGVQTH